LAQTAGSAGYFIPAADLAIALSRGFKDIDRRRWLDGKRCLRAASLTVIFSKWLSSKALNSFLKTEYISKRLLRLPLTILNTLETVKAIAENSPQMLKMAAGINFAF